jgi:hypothetical protein
MAFRRQSRLCAPAMILLTALTALSVVPRISRAENCVVVPSRHAWGAFKPGSWKLVRVVSESLDEQGRVISSRTTSTKSTLVEVDADGYTLEVEAAVSLADKKFVSPVRYVRCSFTGEAEVGHVSYENLAPSSVNIAGAEIPSSVQRIVANGGATKRISTVHYNAEVAPFVLKRQTVSFDAKTESRLGETTVEVLATGVPRLVHSRRRLVSEVKTQSTHSRGRSETIEYFSPEIPGAVVSHRSQEFDPDGRLLARSTLELLDYGVDDGRDPPRPRIFRFWRRNRR